MHAAQGRIIQLDEQSLRRRDRAHMSSNEGEVITPDFEIGSYVLAEHRTNALRSGPASKLLPAKAGPFQIIKKLNEGMYTLRDLITQKAKDFHESNLTKFRYDERTSPPIYAAATDTFDQYVIDHIVEMDGNPRGRKSRIRFKVQWANLPPEKDTWLSWKDGCSTTAVQLFLFNNIDPEIKRLARADFDPAAVDHEQFDRRPDEI